MSLDITAYRNIWKVPENEVIRDEFGDVDYSNVQIVVHKTVLESQNSEFPHRADELIGGEYFANNWKKDSITRSLGYSTYNKWTNELIKISEDFHDLWNFADNEGYIGAAESEKLYHVFRNHYEEGKENELYIFFLNAFDFARHNGIVVYR